jgi:hypothetical protein
VTISLNTFVPGETAASAKVNENFTALKNAVEGINLAQTNSDLFQAGVLNEETDWSFTAGINSANGKLKSEASTGGAAWLPGETSGFVRTFTTSASIPETAPPSVPVEGKWMPIAFELAQSGSAAAVKLHSGAEAASQAAAEETLPGVTAGRTQVRMVIVRNNGGVYSIPNQWDVRSYAVGPQRRIIATEQTRENAAYGKLTTPDEVTVVLAAGGLISVGYQATWKSSSDAGGGASAAIFLGSNQLKWLPDNAVSPTVQAASMPAAGGGHHNSEGLPLTSSSLGLLSGSITPGAYTGDVTTGQIVGAGSFTDPTSATAVQVGGRCDIFAAAGTYSISVQYKAEAAHTVTAKTRKLWASAHLLA